MLSRKAWLMMAALMGVALVACATDFTGWSGEGNPDLASSATWNLESGLPTDAINIKASGYTFEASADATFKAIYWSKAGATNTFKLARDRKITLNNGGGNALSAGGHANYVDMLTKFSGGTWDVGGGFFGPIHHYSWGCKRNAVVLDDGCIVTNVGNMRVAYNANNYGNRLTIQGGAQLHTRSAFLFEGPVCSNVFEVLNGLFTWSNSNLRPGGNDNAHDNVFRVSGPNACVVNLSTSYPYMGGVNAYDSQLIIENGGVWTNSSRGFYLGNGEGAHGQKLIVRSGGKMVSSGHVYINASPGSYGNSIEVLDGGEFDTGSGGIIYMGTATANNGSICGSVFVSNATLRCGRIWQNTGISTGQVVRIMGPDTVFETSFGTSTYPVFGKGSYCLFSLEDRAVWRYDLQDIGYSYTSTYAPSNRIQVINGARLLLGNGLTIGYGDKKTDGHVLYVGNDAEFRCGTYVRIYAHDNTIVVSNALLAVGGKLDFGVEAAETGGFTNNTLTVQGDVPRVRVGGDIEADYGTRIVFNVPDGGYATTNVPITCASWTDVGATKFEFTGLERMVESLKSKVVMPLVQVTNDTFSAKFKASVANAAANLPAKCSLSYSEDNDLLCLTVRPGVGCILLVR